MTEFGQVWTKHYTLGHELIKCELQRTEHPYVYSLGSQDPRVKQNQLAKVMTLEARRYIRVILNKIHSNKNKPVVFGCRPIINLSTHDIEGWVPVRYPATHNLNNHNNHK